MAEANIFDHADVDEDGALSRGEARELFQRMMAAPGARAILAALVANDPDPAPPVQRLPQDTFEEPEASEPTLPEPVDAEAWLEADRARRLTPD